MYSTTKTQMQKCSNCEQEKLKSDLKKFDDFNIFLCPPCHARMVNKMATTLAMAFK